MKLTDLHIHSTYSDGKLTIPDLVDFYGKQAFSAIAITDHLCESGTFLGNFARYFNKTLTKETFPQYIAEIKEEAERAWQQYKMLIIPGVEITKNFISYDRSSHYLALGIDEYVCPEQDVLSCVREIRSRGGLAVAAHPVSTRKIEHQTYYLWDRREEFRQEFDAWEVASGPHLFDEVAESKLPFLATSDLHHPKQINAWKTTFECEMKQEAVLDAIRKQNLDIYFYEKAISSKTIRSCLYGAKEIKRSIQTQIYPQSCSQKSI